jgi:5-methylcytosine-specific restriction endonuclease McrA
MRRHYADRLEYWCGKVRHGGGVGFSPSVGRWAAHLLRELDRRPDRTARAASLPELADELAIPRKFLSRALAASHGLVTLHVDPVRVVLHRKRLLRSKVAIPRSRGHISEQQRDRLFHKDDYKCGHCGRQFDQTDLVIDHLIPLAVRGADHPGNWIAMCSEHNQTKWRHFIYGFVKYYRGKAITGSVGVRFHEGLLWPYVNGHTRIEWRSDWDDTE